MNGQPATKQDVLDLEARMKQDLVDLEARMKRDLLDLDERVTAKFTEALRETETNILKAIFGLVESANKRLSAMEQFGAGLMNRISTLETRLLEVEKRLHIPPRS